MMNTGDINQTMTMSLGQSKRYQPNDDNNDDNAKYVMVF